MWTASARAQYRRSGRRCATDLSDAEFALIGPLLPGCQRRRPTTHHLLARGAERDPVRAAQRLPMAPAAGGFPPHKHGLRLLPSLLAGRGGTGSG